MDETFASSLGLKIRFLSDGSWLGILFAHVILVSEAPVGAECS